METEPQTISKLDAADRQVAEAIRLFYEERDPVAIHTLASAAAQIATDLGEKKGIHAPLRGLKFLSVEKQKVWRPVIKSVENFFKHADRDPDSVLKFPPEITVIYIAEAVSLLGELESEGTVESQVFQAWFVVKYGRMVKFVRDSTVFKHFNIPGTDVNDLYFFSCLIESIKARRNAP